MTQEFDHYDIQHKTIKLGEMFRPFISIDHPKYGPMDIYVHQASPPHTSMIALVHQQHIERFTYTVLDQYRKGEEIDRFIVHDDTKTIAKIAKDMVESVMSALEGSIDITWMNVMERHRPNYFGAYKGPVAELETSSSASNLLPVRLEKLQEGLVLYYLGAIVNYNLMGTNPTHRKRVGVLSKKIVKFTPGADGRQVQIVFDDGEIVVPIVVEGYVMCWWTTPDYLETLSRNFQAVADDRVQEAFERGIEEGVRRGKEQSFGG